MMEELCFLISITSVSKPTTTNDDDKGLTKCIVSHLVNLEGTYAICGQLLDVSDSDCHGSICISSSCGPILVTFDACSFL